ncbi:MAG: nicotinamide-nucleotide amidohydrolase family protein [Lachnospiraceae bacterium]|nr:nicotinamide-nucleotide amidohydrolase family protein [Lachnospiraceae bacterium]
MTPVPIEETAVSLLKEHGLTVAAAESCTGGLLCAKIVNVAGASDVLNEGFITYSNEAKMKHLGVGASTLESHGAVSHECAAEMAAGLAERTGADAALSTTGIAGPGGGTKEKPVGLVYIGCCLFGNVTVKELHLSGSREQIRNEAAKEALELLVAEIKRHFSEK